MAEKGGDVAPWEQESDGRDGLQGRGYFAALGEVRRKPSRRDAEATMSKSCTDKLTVKQVTSTLGFPASLIIASTPSAYLSGLILPSTRYSEEGFRRAFGPSGRLASMQTWELPPCVQYRPFTIERLPADFQPFPFAKPHTAPPPLKAGNVSALFIRGVHDSSTDVQETILAGVKQGHRPFANDPKKASTICRLKLWELVRSLLHLIQDDERIPVQARQELRRAQAARTYCELKLSPLTAHRRVAKAIVTSSLGKWPLNSGDDAWGVP